jgi:hypothetical protein
VLYGCGGGLVILIALLVGGALVIRQWMDAGRQPAQVASAVRITGSAALLSDGVTIVYSDPNGLCRAPQLTATETPARVVLSLSESDGLGSGRCATPTLTRGAAGPVSPVDLASVILPGGPAAFLPSHPATVSLKAPLGDRRLVDATGRTIPYFDQRWALRLAGTAGWSRESGSGSFTTNAPFFGGPGAAVLVENLLGVDSRTHQLNGMSLMIVQVVGGGWHPPDGTTTRPVVVRGHHGIAAAGTIVWSEAGRTVAVIGQGLARQGQLGRAPLPFPRLLAVASALTGDRQA